MAYDAFGTQQQTTQPDFSMAYDSFGNNILVPSGLSGVVFDPVAQQTNAGSIVDGQLNAQVNSVTGFLQSSNFKTGTTGWQINSNGNVEFNAGTFRGALAANSIDIPDTVSANSFHVDTSGNAWWGATALGSAVAKILNTGAATFTSATVSGYTLLSQLRFGGNGSDGALSISSGTTTVNCAGAAVVVKNYTSISITGTGTLAFSNPNASGTVIILKSQGNVTLTSSSAPMIDVRNLGAAGGTGNSITGSNGQVYLLQTTGGKGGSGSPVPGTRNLIVPIYANYSQTVAKYGTTLAVGSGGGSGSQDTGTSGSGGQGSGSLIIECGGAWNFTTSGGISVGGNVGGNATGGTNQGGGGGGGAGMCFVWYNTLTANTGTITITGGGGGTGQGGGAGGDGGASPKNDGSGHAGATGAAGGDGFSLVAINDTFT